jgi:hypothetical protein
MRDELAALEVSDVLLSRSGRCETASFLYHAPD